MVVMKFIPAHMRRKPGSRKKIVVKAHSRKVDVSTSSRKKNLANRIRRGEIIGMKGRKSRKK